MNIDTSLYNWYPKGSTSISVKEYWNISTPHKVTMKSVKQKTIDNTIEINNLLANIPEKFVISKRKHEEKVEGTRLLVTTRQAPSNKPKRKQQTFKKPTDAIPRNVQSKLNQNCFNCTEEEKSMYSKKGGESKKAYLELMSFILDKALEESSRLL
jgi:hypothetical protein